MDTIELAKLRALGTKDFKTISKEESFVPPWMFRHQDLINKLESATHIDQKRLINTLNYIHFTEGFVFIYFSHPTYEEGILVKAYPEPCAGDKIICRWAGNTFSKLQSDGYSFQQLIIADGQSILLVPGRIQRINSESLTIQLPTAGYDICQRRAHRYICQDIQADIIQSGIQVEGILVDFSPLAFCVRALPETSSPFVWFNFEVPTIVHLRKGKQILFSGLCRCIRQMNDIIGREIVLAPLEDKITRLKKAKIRNPRCQLTPTPTITFSHPFFKKTFKREIFDISNSGFSVNENSKERVLMPGMIIPELTIKYAGTLEIKCKTQVIYSQEEGDRARCGLAILDMDMKAYSTLTQILNNTADHHNYISNHIDMDALWKFFFDTDFIYPTKYSFIQSFRHDFKETYRKLYQENPEIARHFTYEKDGTIYGHIAMVRAYERAWMIHHFAAKPMKNKLTAFLVLKQIMQYINGAYKFPSAKMDCVMTYFRKENRLIDRMFGGFARELDNPQGSSLDLFSYLLISKDPQGRELPETWNLRECTDIDLWKLELFYKYQSGGLLIETLGLGKENKESGSLEALYGEQGFVRELKTYSLTHNDDPVAFFIVNQSDVGFNLSELLNGIKIIITDCENVPWNILSTTLSKLSAVYNSDRISILIYPSEYTELHRIQVEKQYQLWILNVARGEDKFLEYMDQNFRMRFK
ncbi:MAG: PilZ domain-containing protein [Deltaproteobacteria bacterium]|nr:PilZ domain-containing protein [Deltaproteobacteria bacterium]